MEETPLNLSVSGTLKITIRDKDGNIKHAETLEVKKE